MIENRQKISTSDLIQILLKELEHRGACAYAGLAYHSLSHVIENKTSDFGSPTYTDEELDQIKQLQEKLKTIMKNASNRFTVKK